MSKCLYRQEDGTWIHSSTKGTTVCFRWYLPNYCEQRFDLSIQSDRRKYESKIATAHKFGLSDAQARLVEFDLGLDAAALPWKRVSDWQKVFKALSDVDWSKAIPTASIWAAVPKSIALVHAIPQTRLRRFYESLRLFPSEKVHHAIASYMCGMPRARTAALQVMFADSRSHFARYSNIEEPFHDRAHTREESGMGGNIEAKELVTQLFPEGRPDAGVVPTEGEFPACKAIDYEISPFRTTDTAFQDARSIFEGGMASRFSGLGGVDLLLRSEENRLPIIAEVKGPDDTNMFLALVQALTYTAELTTPNQIRRLNKHYSHERCEKPFQQDSENRQCDIFLIFFEAKDPPLRDETSQIAEALLKDPGSPVARVVRRIVFVRAIRDDEGKFKLKCEKLCGSVPAVA